MKTAVYSRKKENMQPLKAAGSLFFQNDQIQNNIQKAGASICRNIVV